MGHSTSSGRVQQPERSTSSTVRNEGPVDVGKFQFTNYRNPDGRGFSGRETLRSALADLSRETETVRDRVLRNYAGGMSPASQARAEFRNIMSNASVRDIATPSAQQGVKDAHSAIAKRQTQIASELETYTQWDSRRRQWVKP